jgi:uncharacterized protein (DUF2236 family)
MLWVHIAEVESFLRLHQRYGAERLTLAEADGYVDDMARVAIELGVPSPPRSVRELTDALQAFRPELRGTAQSRQGARFVLTAPIPLAGRGPFTVLVAAAIAELPWWARWELRLPVLPITESVLVRPAAKALVDLLRWALEAPPPQRVDA